METYIDKIIYFLVALAGITLAMNRDLWSPCIENFSALRPTAPVLNMPSPGNGLVNLSWSPSVNATSYKIKAHDILANTYLYRDTNNLSYTFTNLTNGRAYNFSVVGKNSRSESGSSNTRGPIIPSAAPIIPSATPIIPSAAPIVHSAPLNVRADILDSEATISWTKPTNSIGITGYFINRQIEFDDQIIIGIGSSIIVQGENTLSALIGGINPAHTYTISVRALYQGGPPTGGPPSIPIILPQMYISPGINSNYFTVTLRFFNNTGARLLVDTNPPNDGGQFTLISNDDKYVTDSNYPPDSTLVGADALSYTNSSL